LKPGWLIVAGLALAGMWFGLPPMLRRLDFFRVRRIEVRGLNNLSADLVIRALKLSPKVSVFDDLSAAERRLDSMPGLVGVELSRRPPGTLVIEVREVDPVALTMRAGKLQLVDRDGRLLPFDPTLAAPDLPMVQEPDSLVARLLGRIRDTDATLFARLLSGWRSGNDVVVQVENRRYLFRPDAPAEVIRAVTAVAQDLARKKRGYAELDGRFAGYVVVRGKGA
jgi:cell division septal protein FtsQ